MLVYIYYRLECRVDISHSLNSKTHVIVYYVGEGEAVRRQIQQEVMELAYIYIYYIIIRLDYNVCIMVFITINIMLIILRPHELHIAGSVDDLVAGIARLAHIVV